jgi:RNA polymerase sigma-70 factor, ECF subfamily
LEGPQAGLYALEWVKTDKRVNEYQPYWAVRANLLARTGKCDEARHAYEIAIGLESDPAVRTYLQQLCDELPE